jgi:hypothetical protein
MNFKLVTIHNNEVFDDYTKLTIYIRHEDIITSEKLGIQLFKYGSPQIDSDGGGNIFISHDSLLDISNNEWSVEDTEVISFLINESWNGYCILKIEV